MSATTAKNIERGIQRAWVAFKNDQALRPQKPVPQMDAFIAGFRAGVDFTGSRIIAAIKSKATPGPGSSEPRQPQEEKT